MVKKNRIPNEVLKNIFPEKLIGRQTQMKLYTQLKEMILSGRWEKGHKLSYEDIVQDFNVSRRVVYKAFSQLKKDGLIISTRGEGLFIA
jgi:DNA-binding GntR family transcriptional regulator